MIINPGVGIDLFPNTDFYEMGTQLLFDDHFRPRITKQHGGEDVTRTNIVLQASKQSVNIPIKSWG